MSFKQIACLLYVHAQLEKGVVRLQKVSNSLLFKNLIETISIKLCILNDKRFIVHHLCKFIFQSDKHHSIRFLYIRCFGLLLLQYCWFYFDNVFGFTFASEMIIKTYVFTVNVYDMAKDCIKITIHVGAGHIIHVHKGYNQMHT